MHARSRIMEDVALKLALGAVMAALDFTRPIWLAFALPVYLAHVLGYFTDWVIYYEVRLQYFAARFRPVRDWLLGISRLARDMWRRTANPVWKLMAPLRKAIMAPLFKQGARWLKFGAQLWQTLFVNRLDFVHRWHNQYRSNYPHTARITHGDEKPLRASPAVSPARFQDVDGRLRMGKSSPTPSPTGTQKLKRRSRK
jgi:hypothetical protein